MPQEVYKDGIAAANAMQKAKRKWQPLKETIWNDPNHPLYGIGPDEQNEEYLNSAIKEIERNTQSPAHFKFYAGGSGGTMAESRKKLKQYQKALKFIKDWENNADWADYYFGGNGQLPF